MAEPSGLLEARMSDKDETLSQRVSLRSAMARNASTTSFERLLSALGEQHSREVSEAHKANKKLREENERLKEELRKASSLAFFPAIISGTGSANCGGASGPTGSATLSERSPLNETDFRSRTNSLTVSAVGDVNGHDQNLRDIASGAHALKDQPRALKPARAWENKSPGKSGWKVTKMLAPGTRRFSAGTMSSASSNSESIESSSTKANTISALGRRRLGGMIRAVTKPLTGGTSRDRSPPESGVDSGSDSPKNKQRPPALKVAASKLSRESRESAQSNTPGEGKEKSRKQEDDNALLAQTVERLEQDRRRRKREHFRAMFNIRGKKNTITAADLTRVLNKRGKIEFTMEHASTLLALLSRLADDFHNKDYGYSAPSSPRQPFPTPKIISGMMTQVSSESREDHGFSFVRPVLGRAGSMARRKPRDRTASLASAAFFERAKSGLFRTRSLSVSTRELCFAMNFSLFVDMMLSPTLASRIEDPIRAMEVREVQDMLLIEDTEQVIAKVTHATTDMSEEKLVDHSWQAQLLWYLNVIVSLAVVTSLVTYGLSLDITPDWMGWLFLQALCTLVFVSELLIKLWLLGWGAYFCKKGERLWNWTDSTITCISIFDLGLYALSNTTNGASFARISLVLRSLRLVRIVRLVKLLRLPLFHELGSMLTGLLIGLPWLVWVICLLCVVIFSAALFLRQAVGPEGETCHTDCTGQCMDDNADEIAQLLDLPPTCKLHYLFGEEYFGTLSKSMFTVFRCMIGDCTTRSGRALAVELSKGFGVKFDLYYSLCMVAAIFGLFNVVTALFVESTLSALKYNELQRKKARQYETHWVQQKLEILIERIASIVKNPRLGRPSAWPASLTLTEDDLREVLEDKIVRDLLHDIDVIVDIDSSVYEMFEWNASGKIGLSEFVTTIMKLRGDLQKTDMVATWVALRSLSDRFQEFQLVLLANQRQMMTNHDHLLNHTRTGGAEVVAPAAAAAPQAEVQAEEQRDSGKDATSAAEQEFSSEGATGGV